MRAVDAIEISSAPERCNIEVPALNDGDLVDLSTGRKQFDFVREAAGVLDRDCVVRFRIGGRWSRSDEALSVAKAVAEGLSRELKQRGAPTKMYVEVDKAQTTYVPEGFKSRTLLPHHDAAHVSYLTPSKADLPSFQDAHRSFSGRGYTSGKAHKMYQGIFISDAGEVDSITAYYPLVPLIAKAYAKSHGLSRPPSLKDCAKFLGKNIELAITARENRSANYLTLPAALGSHLEVFNSLAPHAGEADFSAENYERFPRLRTMVEHCACGKCVGAQGRLFCQSIQDTVGIGWYPFNSAHGVAVRSDTFDLIMANNLSLIHAGLGGGAGRILVPICLVIEDTDDPQYESWLANAWRQQPMRDEVQSFWPTIEKNDVLV
ncbi:hypothetical protein [Sinorhizobium medicae]